MYPVMFFGKILNSKNQKLKKNSTRIFNFLVLCESLLWVYNYRTI